MKAAFAFGLILLMPGTRVMAATAEEVCPVSHIKGAQDFHDEHVRRAFEIVEIAGKSGAANEARLAALIHPGASFSFAEGHTIQALGTGTGGARQLAAEIARIKPDAFRYIDYRDINWPIENPCSDRAPEQITLEFVDTRNRRVLSVGFFFESGRLSKAEGMLAFFVTGTLKQGPVRR